MRRTNDGIFFPCPICGKKPYVTYYPPDTGWARCSGTFFKPHDTIEGYVNDVPTEQLVMAVASKWNQGQFLKWGE